VGRRRPERVGRRGQEPHGIQRGAATSSRWPRRRWSAPGPGTEDTGLDGPPIVARVWCACRQLLDACSVGASTEGSTAMPVTITRTHRDAIYEMLINHLSGIGDVWLGSSAETSPTRTPRAQVRRGPQRSGGRHSSQRNCKKRIGGLVRVGPPSPVALPPSMGGNTQASSCALRDKRRLSALSPPIYSPGNSLAKAPRTCSWRASSSTALLRTVFITS
jgi:hypothetical protein